MVKKDDVVIKKDVEGVSPEHASTNFFWTYGTEEVFNIQTTMRGILTADQVDAHISSAAYAMRRVVELGGHAKQVGRQPEGNGSQNTPAPLPVPPTGVSTDTDPDATYTFPAERLVGKLEGGKSYWKVQGGKFSKFGVNIWPEVLFAADLKNLDPATVYDLTGYTAYYTMKDNGKEDKVVNLSKE